MYHGILSALFLYTGGTEYRELLKTFLVVFGSFQCSATATMNY